MEKKVKIQFDAALNSVPQGATIEFPDPFSPTDLPASEGLLEGKYVLNVDEHGDRTWVEVEEYVNPYPALPEVDGEYELHVVEGTPTWVVKSAE